MTRYYTSGNQDWNEHSEPVWWSGKHKHLGVAGHGRIFYSVLLQLQFSKATSGCHLLFRTVEIEEGKHYLEGSSGVMNSFIRMFKQNGIVIWPGDRKDGKYAMSPAVPYKWGHSVFPFLSQFFRLSTASYENFSYSFLENFHCFLFDLLPASLGFKDMSRNLDVECLLQCASGIIMES